MFFLDCVVFANHTFLSTTAGVVLLTLTAQYISKAQVCIYCMYRQAFCRVQSSAGDGQGQSHVPAPDHAFLPSCSRPHLSIHSSADFNTDLYSFTQCELSMERGETGVRKDRKGQCVSDCLDP